MITSTLNPGVVSPSISKLRDAALKEMSGSGANEKSQGTPEFDQTHAATPANDQTSTTFDTNNWVAKYPGQNSEHIGNGSGGIR